MFCKEHMASIKIPNEFIIRDELSLTPVGNVNKKPLTPEIKEEFDL